MACDVGIGVGCDVFGMGCDGGSFVPCELGRGSGSGVGHDIDSGDGCVVSFELGSEVGVAVGLEV